MKRGLSRSVSRSVSFSNQSSIPGEDLSMKPRQQIHRSSASSYSPSRATADEVVEQLSVVRVEQRATLDPFFGSVRLTEYRENPRTEAQRAAVIRLGCYHLFDP